jgi:hypothetical protein
MRLTATSGSDYGRWLEEELQAGGHPNRALLKVR